MASLETLLLEPGDGVPNSSLPVLLYRRAFAPGPDLADRLEAAFERHGWRGLWRNGIYPWHHFHDNAHEVLGIAAGEAEVQLGGANGPEVRLSAGDVVVLPAGTGHKRLSASPDLLVVGGYPAGQEAHATLRAGAGGGDVTARCVAVPLPASDPVTGGHGELVQAWQSTTR